MSASMKFFGRAAQRRDWLWSHNEAGPKADALESDVRIGECADAAACKTRRVCIFFRDTFQGEGSVKCPSTSTNRHRITRSGSAGV